MEDQIVVGVHEVGDFILNIIEVRGQGDDARAGGFKGQCRSVQDIGHGVGRFGDGNAVDHKTGILSSLGLGKGRGVHISGSYQTVEVPDCNGIVRSGFGAGHKKAYRVGGGTVIQERGFDVRPGIIDRQPQPVQRVVGIVDFDILGSTAYFYGKLSSFNFRCGGCESCGNDFRLCSQLAHGKGKCSGGGLAGRGDIYHLIDIKGIVVGKVSLAR